MKPMSFRTLRRKAMQMTRGLAVLATFVLLGTSSSDAQQCTQGTYTTYTGMGCCFGGLSCCCETIQFFCGTEVPTGVESCRSNPQEACGELGQCPAGQVGFCDPSPPSCGGDETSCSEAVGDGCDPEPDPYDPGPSPDGPSPEGPSPSPSPSPSPAPAPPSPCPKAGNIGEDPLLIASKAAATTPFTDFAVDRVSRLALNRSYNSSDQDLQTGTGGVFGVAWHHNWEATLSCSGSVCTVKRGLKTGWRFSLAGTYPSLDGTESWSVYQAWAPPPYKPTHRHLLVRRAD